MSSLMIILDVFVILGLVVSAILADSLAYS